MNKFIVLSLLVLIFIISPMATSAALDDDRIKIASDLRNQITTSEKLSTLLTERLQLLNKISTTLASNTDSIFHSSITIDRLLDSLMGVTQQKNLDTIMAEFVKPTDVAVNLKVISDETSSFLTTDSPEDLRKALSLILESTEKSVVLGKEIETVINMTPDQVIDKLRKNALLPQPLKMIPPDSFDKTKQTISQEDLNSQIAQNKVVKVVDFQELLEPDEKQILSGKSEFIRNVYQSLSKELSLLGSKLRYANIMLSTEIAETNRLLRYENSKMILLKSDLVQYSAE